VRFENPHQQRQLESDQHADDEHQAIKYDVKPIERAECQEEHRRRRAAHERHAEFHFDEPPRLAVLNPT
jgi:hypothetical protein